MEKLNKKPLLVPYNLQLFAEDNGNNGNDGDNGAGNNGGQEPPKQKYSDSEYEKLKAAFDKEVSEKAALKKQLQSKQTDEEKAAEEKANRDTEFQNLQKELKTLKTKAALLKGFEEKDADTLTKCIVEGNSDKLIETILKLKEDLTTSITEKAKKEFMQSAHIPGAAGKTEDSIGKKLAMSFKKEKPSNTAWGQFDNK